MAAEERRTYRVSIGAWWWMLFLMAVLLAVLLGRLYSRTDLVGAGLVWTGVGVGVIFALLLTWLARTATVVTDAGLVVRGLFRSRFYPWAEIADIQEDDFGQAVLYDRDLRQVPLPHFARKRLGGEFAVELDSLTARWETRRGPGWRSRADELAQRAATVANKAHVSQKRANVFTWALVAALLSFVAIMVVMATSDYLTISPVVELLIWPGMLAVPVVVFLLVYVVGSARIRARKRH